MAGANPNATPTVVEPHIEIKVKTLWQAGLGGALLSAVAAYRLLEMNLLNTQLDIIGKAGPTILTDAAILTHAGAMIKDHKIAQAGTGIAALAFREVLKIAGVVPPANDPFTSFLTFEIGAALGAVVQDIRNDLHTNHHKAFLAPALAVIGGLGATVAGTSSGVPLADMATVGVGTTVGLAHLLDHFEDGHIRNDNVLFEGIAATAVGIGTGLTATIFGGASPIEAASMGVGAAVVTELLVPGALLKVQQMMA